MQENPTTGSRPHEQESLLLSKTKEKYPNNDNKRPKYLLFPFEKKATYAKILHIFHFLHHQSFKKTKFKNIDGQVNFEEAIS